MGLKFVDLQIFRQNLICEILNILLAQFVISSQVLELFHQLIWAELVEVLYLCCAVVLDWVASLEESVREVDGAGADFRGLGLRLILERQYTIHFFVAWALHSRHIATDLYAICPTRFLRVLTTQLEWFQLLQNLLTILIFLILILANAHFLLVLILVEIFERALKFWTIFIFCLLFDYFLFPILYTVLELLQALCIRSFPLLSHGLHEDGSECGEVFPILWVQDFFAVIRNSLRLLRDLFNYYFVCIGALLNLHIGNGGRLMHQRELQVEQAALGVRFGVLLLPRIIRRFNSIFQSILQWFFNR